MGSACTLESLGGANLDGYEVDEAYRDEASLESLLCPRPRSALGSSSGLIKDEPILLDSPAVVLVFLDKAPSNLDSDCPLSAREPVFKTRLDIPRSFVFHRRPLGITFTRDQAPLIIIGVDTGGEGEAAGVRQGMELHMVGDTELSGMLYKESFEYLVKALEVLPLKKTA